MWWIAMLYLTRIVALTETDVYVGGEGHNTDTCGTEVEPCKTLEYIINTRHPSTSTLCVKVVSPIHEPDTVYIGQYILRTGHFTVEGVCGDNSTINVNGQRLFHIFSSSFSITFKNLLVNIKKAFFFFESSGSVAVKVSMTNTTLQHTQQSVKSEYPIMHIGVVSNKKMDSCGVTVMMDNCKFNNINSFRLLYIYTENCDTSLQATNTVFHNNTFAHSGLLVWPRRSFGRVRLTNCTADSNTVKSYFGALFEVIFTHVSDVQVIGCNFTRNKGGVVMLRKLSSGIDTKVNIVIRDTSLTNNKQMGAWGSGLALRRIDGLSSNNQSQAWNVIVDNVSAQENQGTPLLVSYEKTCGIGEKCAKVKQGIDPFIKLEVRVKSCQFRDNYGSPQGGAISANTNSYMSTVRLMVVSSRFYRNTAGTGGAIATNCHTSIEKSKFFFNYAAVGGSISLRGMQGTTKRTDTRRSDINEMTVNLINDTSFITKTIALDSTTDLDISNTSFQLSNHESGNFGLFRHQSSTQFLNIVDKLKLDCGTNRNLSHTIHKASYNLLSKEELGKDSNFISSLSVSCKSCEKGRYSIREGKASWYDGELNTSTVECFPCPRGGNCEMGSLRSRRDYWGYLAKNKKVKFLLCPKGYCSEKPTTYNNCSKNRHGVLCSECQKDSSLNILSSECVKTETCDVSSMFYILGLYPCVLTLLVIAMIFKEKLKQFLKSITRKLKRKFRVVKKSLKICCKYNDTGLVSVETEQESDCGVDDGKSILKQFLLVISFFQLQSLIYIPNTVLTPVWGSLQNYLGSLSMFNFLGGGTLNSTVKYCLPEEFTFLHRSLFNICINLSPIILSLIIYILVSFCEQWCGQRPSLKLQIQCTALTFIAIFYIPLSSTLFQLITCVEIEQNGVVTSVLFSQGSVECFKEWQYGIIIFICIYLAWYFLVLYVGTLYLRQESYTEFVVMVFLPPTAVFFLLKHECVRRCDSTEDIKDDSTTNEPSESEATHSLLKQDIIETQFSASVEEHVEPGPSTIEIENKSIAQPTFSLEDQFSNKRLQEVEDQYKALIDAIQGTSRIDSWPAIVVLRNLSVALVPVLFRHHHSQVLSLLVIILLYLILLVRLRPYTDNVMNMLEPTLMAMLLLLGVCGIVNTTYLTSSDDNIRSFLKIIDYLRFVLLLLPLPVWIIFIVIDKYILPKINPQNAAVQSSTSSNNGLNDTTTAAHIHDVDDLLMQRNSHNNLNRKTTV